MQRGGESMLEGRYIFGDEDITDALEIRRCVFNLEQGLPEVSTMDEVDENCIIAIAYFEKKAVATGRLLFDGQDYLISKIAVLQEYRGNNYGDFIVRMLIDKAIKFGATKINVISQLPAKAFYEKIGFVEHGEIFVEDNIQRVPMILEIENLFKKCNKK
jgi:predicted GNAT family N-acyltransferase